MLMLLLRLLPLLSAGMALIASVWQWRFPLQYPWPLVACLTLYLAAASAIAWRRTTLMTFVQNILPAAICLAAISLGFLMVGTSLERWCLAILLAGVSWLVLELFFLFIWNPSRYPVNGLSHVHVALVPLTMFFLAATTTTLWIYLHIPRWYVLMAFIFVPLVLFLLTAHPTSDRRQRLRWALAAGIFGFQAGLVSLLLPIPILAQGSLAALFIVFPLRLRRYAYQPLPPMRIAWLEGIAGAVLFITVLATSRWA